MRKIAIANMKGGTAKTTVAIHLAGGLSGRGHRVLLIDTDPQGNIGHALGLHPTPDLRQLLLGEAPLESVIQREARQNLDIITATPAAFSLERQLAGATQRETLLHRRLRTLSGYDAVILDTSPAMSLLTLNTLLYAEQVILPVAMDSMAIVGARQTLNGIAELRELWPERRLELLAVLPTFVNFATVATRKTFEAFEADPEMSARLFRRGIRQCLDLTYAIANRQTIWEYAPRSRAAEDFGAFLDFVLEEAACSEESPRHAWEEKSQAVV